MFDFSLKFRYVFCVCVCVHRVDITACVQCVLVKPKTFGIWMKAESLMFTRRQSWQHQKEEDRLVKSQEQKRNVL